MNADVPKLRPASTTAVSPRLPRNGDGPQASADPVSGSFGAGNQKNGRRETFENIEFESRRPWQNPLNDY